MSDKVVGYRIKYFPTNDYAFSPMLGKAIDRLRNFDPASIFSINDAIELRQCRLLFDEGMPLLEWEDEQECSSLAEVAKQANAVACRLIKAAVETVSIGDIVAEVGEEYKSCLWELVVATGSERDIPTNDFSDMLSGNNDQLRIVLRYKKIVNRFSEAIRESMLFVPESSCDIVLHARAISSNGQSNIFLPPVLTKEDVELIMDSYVNQPNPNPNYLNVIANWSSNSEYSLSDDVRLAAKRKYDEVMTQMFSGEGFFKYAVGVEFSDTQNACVHLSFDGLDHKYVYGLKWIKTFSDYPTLLNNFIHIFNFADNDVNLAMPTRENDVRTLLDVLSIRSSSDYHMSISGSMADTTARMVIRGYRDVLSSIEIRLEDVIAWFFNEYLTEEFGIGGIHVNMPSVESTYLEKCRTIGAEVESALKAFALYVERGEIDQELLSYKRFPKFGNLPSLVDRKYARVVSDELKTMLYWLFSDQSTLHYTKTYGDGYQSLFKLIIKENLTLADFEDHQRPAIEKLIMCGALAEKAGTQKLYLTSKVSVLEKFWTKGVAVYCRQDSIMRKMIDNLATAGHVNFYSSLFSENEADYMSFNFHNEKFGNARAVRNDYSHGSPIAGDPNDPIHQANYEILLLLMVLAVLKINDDLCLGQSRYEQLELVDWPYRDVDVDSIPDKLLE